jgi:cystathionine gamma-synthase
MANTPKRDTLCVHGVTYFDEKTGAISFPIYQSATFRHPSLGNSTGYDYTRQQNPTREELEKTIALLENGVVGIAFATGMAAITATLSLFLPGDHIIATDDLYGGTVRLFDAIYSKYGIECTYVDTSNSNEIKKFIKKNTKAIYIESPSNPMMKINDLKETSKISKEHNLLLIVDNTFLTPYFINPIDFGADIVIHSGTKFLSGHNDTLSGFVITANQDLGDKILFYQKSAGGGISPFDAWLVLRGMKTLSVRMEKIERNAQFIVEKLKNIPKIKKIYYPGLSNHPGHDLIKSQSRGFGGMISFEVDTVETVKRILEKVKIILFAESLGGVESLITYPMVQTHADVPLEKREKLGLNDRLIRFSVGIENPEDLANDLINSME